MSNVFPPFEPEKPRRKGPFAFVRRSEVPVRVLIPNILTLVGLCAGLTGIRMAIEGRYEMAIGAIVLAAVLDALDGRIARLLKATTRFGAELDSLADFVNFGVAPAIIIFTWALGDLKSFGWIVVMVFALCAVLRLARFNVSLDATDQPIWKANFFVGVPAPAGALLLLLPLYIEALGVPNVKLFAPVILVYTIAIAFLMVSNIPTYSGKLVGQMVGRHYVLPVFVLTVLYIATLVTYPFWTMTLSAFGYLAFIPVSFLRYQKLEERLADEPTPEPMASKKPTPLGERLKSANDDQAAS